MDGESHNRSWNCGVEGPTDDPEILELRARQHRNFLVTLLLSQGVPMLLHGDEIARTQDGNNNVYCQDDEISWVDWDLDQGRSELLEFTRRVIHLRRDHPVLRRRRFFAGAAEHGGESDLQDIAWFSPSGDHMAAAAWHEDFARAVMVFLNGEAIGEPGARGEPVVDDSFLVLYNAHHEDLDFTMPVAEFGQTWTCVLDTDHNLDPVQEVKAGETISVTGRSTVVLTRPAGGVDRPAVAEPATPAAAGEAAALTRGRTKAGEAHTR